jgi:hypothetical protein
MYRSASESCTKELEIVSVAVWKRLIYIKYTEVSTKPVIGLLIKNVYSLCTVPTVMLSLCLITHGLSCSETRLWCLICQDTRNR